MYIYIYNYIYAYICAHADVHTDRPLRAQPEQQLKTPCSKTQ